MPDRGASASRIGSRDPLTANLPTMSPEPTSVPTGRDDWAARVTEKVEEIVALVRERTVHPVQQVVRGVIFGMIAFAIFVVVVVIVAVGLVRILNNLVFHSHVWASYLLVGGIFVVVGLLLSTMRNRQN